MKKSTKLLIGVATLWPIAYLFVFIIVAMLLFFAAAGTNSSNPGASPLFGVGFAAFMLLHFFTILESLALPVFYVKRVFKTEQLDQNLKIMWTLLSLYFGISTSGEMALADSLPEHL